MNRPTSVQASEYDLIALTRQLDRVKADLFISKHRYASFYGSVLCSLDFIWSNDIPTAATDGVYLYWNPEFFLRTNRETSGTVLMHELDHVVKLHQIRRGDRDPKLWNYACDIRINNELDQMGYSFKGVRPWLSHAYDKGGVKTEEEIYDMLLKDTSFVIVDGAWGEGDEGDIIQGDLTEEEKNKMIRNIIIAVQTTEQNGGEVPGDTKEILDQFLNPIIPWEQTFLQFFKDLAEEDFTWRRPSRRSVDVYLPSRFEDEGRLEHLLYVQDVSGSISVGDMIRFNSELKYVWDTLQPKKMTIIQFDTEIKNILVKNEGDPFDFIERCGFGGTDLQPVREWILENQPTAAVIFSDLFCDPMDCSGITCPIIWVAISNRSAQVETGKLIHIK